MPLCISIFIIIYNIRKMWVQQYFEKALSYFKGVSQYQEFINKLRKKYNLKNTPFQKKDRKDMKKGMNNKDMQDIDGTHKKAIIYVQKNYKQLQEKYQKGQIKVQPRSWNNKQQKLYLWFMLCYIEMKRLDPIKLVNGQSDWKHISSIFWNKDTLFLKYQLLATAKSEGRVKWTAKEDELLKKVYPNHNQGDWNEVAKRFYFVSVGQLFKTPKQCSERWQNHLNENIKKGQWTLQEDRIIFQYVKNNGCHWAEMIDLLPSLRTEHMIKNRFNAVVHKLKQEHNLSDTAKVVDLFLETNTEKVIQVLKKNQAIVAEEDENSSVQRNTNDSRRQIQYESSQQNINLMSNSLSSQIFNAANQSSDAREFRDSFSHLDIQLGTQHNSLSHNAFYGDHSRLMVDQQIQNRNVGFNGPNNLPLLNDVNVNERDLNNFNEHIQDQNRSDILKNSGNLSTSRPLPAEMQDQSLRECLCNIQICQKSILLLQHQSQSDSASLIKSPRFLYRISQYLGN